MVLDIKATLREDNFSQVEIINKKPVSQVEIINKKPVSQVEMINKKPVSLKFKVK